MADHIQSAIERAKAVAAKLSGQIPNDGSSSKRPADSSNDSSAKKFASVNDAVGAQLAMFKAQQLGGATQEDIRVPDKLVGLVIGRGGEQLQRLQSESQCKVQIAADSQGSTDRTFTLYGTKEAIDKAKKLIDEILKRGSSLGSDPNSVGPSVVLQRNNVEIVEIKVPGNKCGLVIGKGGETIKRLSEQYGVKLVVVQESNQPTGGDKPLRITGEPDKVAKAKDAVLQMLNPTGPTKFQTNEYGSSKYGGGNEVFIKVPGDKAGIVIGKGGESIKEINRRSGAHVEIDKSQRGASATDGTDKMFVIRGTPEQIQYAQQLIYEKITGIQGSQPPVGYFNSSEASPMQGSYGTSRSGNGSTTPNYQQQWGNMSYQQPWHTGDASKSVANDPSAAWAAYYQQYYGTTGQPLSQGGQGATGQSNNQTGASTAQPSINPQTGQPDYSQAWVEYYRSLGMYEQADAILKQTSSASSSTTTGQSATQSPSTAANNTANHQNGTSSYGTSASGSWSNTYGGYPNYGNYYKQEGTNGQ